MCQRNRGKQSYRKDKTMDELLTELLCQRDENKALKDHIRLLNFILCLAVPCWFVAVAAFVYAVYFR